MIEGVKTKNLRVIPDERGWLMEILRCDDDIFQSFGQVYLTTAYPDVVKAWHYHKKQTDNFTCIKGMMKVALYDDRPGSPTFGQVNEFFYWREKSSAHQRPAAGISRLQGYGRRDRVLPERAHPGLQL